ncbi:MAG: phosphatidate cytidylyltransferase [Proteobacteria bacterium]|nr:phosphatidate cytidylyltransferase [Pseudomonadota bacterium]
MEKGNIFKSLVGFPKKLLNTLNDLLEKVTKSSSANHHSSNLKKRIISSIVMVPVAIYAFYFSKALFSLLIIAATILMTFEWLELTKSAVNKKKWHLIGFFYIAIPVWSILELRDIDSNIILWMFFLIWATDIFAYFAGKHLGGPKLAPTISPNKTWSGMAGGVLASMVIGFLSSFTFAPNSILFFVTVSAIISVIEQLSDLVESKFKRVFGVKDSGDIIPGHGGVLDRLDGIIFVAPTVLLLVHIYSEKFIIQ